MPKRTTNKARAQRAAVQTLKHLKYTYRGGVHWAPPIGPAPTFLDPSKPEDLKAATKAMIAAIKATPEHLMEDASAIAKFVQEEMRKSGTTICN